MKLIIQRICPLLSDTFFDWIEIWFFSYSRLIRTFDLRIDFFEIFFVTTFLWVFLLILFRDFFYKLFLKKGMGESWAPTLPKICVFDLKNNLSPQKKDRKNHKNHFRKISSILDIKGSILATVKTPQDFEILKLKPMKPKLFICTGIL